MELSSPISIVPFERSHVDRVLALWRLLHPDWPGLTEPSADKFFEACPDRELIRYVVEHGHAVVATVFTSRVLDSGNRFISLEARPGDVGAKWLRTVLRSLAEADRERPGTRQVLNMEPNLSMVLRPLVEAEAFVLSFKTLRIEWSGESVTIPDSGTIRFERYTGGNREIDAAIVDLHNRAYSAAWMKPSANPETLWTPTLRIERREFVLALEDKKLVGYVEWCVDTGEAWVNSYVVARPHWGTAVAGMLLTKVIEAVLEQGHTKFAAHIRSTNAAVMRHMRALGCTIAADCRHTFVRKF